MRRRSSPSRRRRASLASSRRSRGSKRPRGGLLALAILLALGRAAGADEAPGASGLHVRWTSVAGFVLGDGETTLLFDPIFTRPGILNWLGLKELAPDPAAIEENLAALGLTRADAVFVSHEHFDHAVDAPTIARRFGAPLYGGKSLERIARANERRFGWTDLRFRSVADRETIRIGKFRIKFFWRSHAAIFPKIGFHWLAGEVPADFDFGFYQYREGDVLCWVIDHPGGRIFVDQGSNFFEGVREDLRAGADYMLIGVSNKKSVADFVGKYVAGYRPKLLVPLHFDFFFAAPDRKNARMLPGIEYDRIVAESAKVSPGTRFVLPKFGETIRLGE